MTRTVLTMAGLTLREAFRRRVLLAVVVLTVALLALSGWGFSRLAAESDAGALTSGEARLVAATLLNLVMFGFSLIAALGTAFLAGPTLSGETESGIALAVLARPVRRSAVLLTSPSNRVSSPAAICSSVDLPQPLGPTIAVNSCRGTSRVKSRSASTV